MLHNCHVSNARHAIAARTIHPYHAPAGESERKISLKEARKICMEGAHG